MSGLLNSDQSVRAGAVAVLLADAPAPALRLAQVPGAKQELLVQLFDYPVQFVQRL